MKEIHMSRREPEESEEPFLRDVEKILHSKTYVRYADKTQVVYLLPHDHIAYRGLHVQLVSVLARSIGRKIGLSLDLLEAISLGHDMGHAPFGHEGEGYLNILSQEAGLGGFSHARQSCRVASEIENLNLTLATLDGFLCHDGGMKAKSISLNDDISWSMHEKELADRLENPEGDLPPFTQEAALVKIADTVSYLERDLEDACTLGILQRNDVPKTILGGQSLSSAVVHDIVSQYNATRRIGLSDHIYEAIQVVRAFNFERIYFHDRLKTESKKIHTAYRLLFPYFWDDWKQSGRDSVLWKRFLHNKASSYIEKYPPAQHVVDYIAGMTDGYFLRIFQELFVPKMIEVPNVLPFS